ncbi:MAG: hypothetical protein [Olavius algarvensis spirochete endosymbiont]|nr:MAG: hypothetical protein [Olavius algarvensis spirochete endosymbiont]
MHAVRGGRDHRRRPQHRGQPFGIGITPAHMSGEHRNHEPPGGVDHQHPRIPVLGAEMRGDQPHHGAHREEEHQLVERGEDLRDAATQGPRVRDDPVGKPGHRGRVPRGHHHRGPRQALRQSVRLQGPRPGDGNQGRVRLGYLRIPRIPGRFRRFRRRCASHDRIRVGQIGGEIEPGNFETPAGTSFLSLLRVAPRCSCRRHDSSRKGVKDAGGFFSHKATKKDVLSHSRRFA